MNIIKSTGTFSFYTLISRISGYLRDILIAIFLGSGSVADAFFVAFRIPNTFRRLFGEGSFNAAFVPSYSKELVKGKRKSENFANNIFNLLFLGLLFLTIVIEIFMPAFVFMIAPGFVDDFEKMEVEKDKLIQKKSIELGHIFLFGQKYSKPFDLQVDSMNGKVFPYMGSYGIGVSRIPAAVIEKFHDGKGMVWPKEISPFQIIIINLLTKDKDCCNYTDSLY